MYDEDEFEIGLDTPTDAYAEKGKQDRAFVDQQAKDYDELKRKKREELSHLKIHRQEAQSKLARKERELHTLDLSIRKDEYLETRERVQDVRDVVMQGNEISREMSADTEVAAINLATDRHDREDERARLAKECALLKTNADEAARKISLLEYEILRL